MSDQVDLVPLAQPSGELQPSTKDFAWQTVQVTYIVPFLLEVDEAANTRGEWTKSDPRKEKADGRVKGKLSASVDAGRKKDGGAPSPISSKITGAPIRRALGRLDPSGRNSVIREQWIPREPFQPTDVREWSAERLHFTIGKSTRKFLVISVDIEPGTDIENFLVKARDGRNTAEPGALAEILEVIQPEIALRGDGGVHTAKAKVYDELASRFLISTVTMAVPSGPGEPPPLRFLDGYGNWGDTPELKWSYFLATHQKHNRRLPPDTDSFANGGFLNNAGAYDVRVEPFGTSIVFTDAIPEAWWDQLQVLNSSANPFVELAILSYWQHTCLEYFTDELAEQAHPSNVGQSDLKDSLEALREFGDDYFFFRNCIWFDSVPNQPRWSEYLRKLQESQGDREALARLAVDYKDWTSHLGNRVALEEEGRRTLNERQVKTYSAIGAGAGIVFALLTLLFEPGSDAASAWGWGLASLIVALLLAVALVFHQKKKSLQRTHLRS